MGKDIDENISEHINYIAEMSGISVSMATRSVINGLRTEKGGFSPRKILPTTRR